MSSHALFNCLGHIALVAAATTVALSQESDPMNVAVAVRGGITLATSRGDFPSIIVGDSKRGTGSIGQQYGESGVGNRIDVSALIPFTNSFGLSVALGTQAIGVSYAEDSSRLSTRVDVQTMQGQVGVQWSVLHDVSSYHTAGLRSIYVDGGFDFGLATIANRVESSSYADTLQGPPTRSVGSFANDEPFRNVVALRGAVGLRFAAAPNIEIIAEASYAHALNPMFSSEAIDDNDFTIDVLSAIVGVGYRF